jgi:transposase
MQQYHHRHLTKRKVSAFGKSFRIVQLEQEMVISNSKGEHEALKKDNSVFSVIQSIIGNNNSSSFHMPVVVHKTHDDEPKMSRSPSFL